MSDTLIVGCGMAGAAAAVAAAEAGGRVTVLDSNRKPLKKLGATGNGRGNLMNAGELRCYGDARFGDAVMAAMPYAAVRRFWEDIGVTLTEEAEGRIYPAALLASVAADALLLRMKALGVKIVSNARVTSLAAIAQGFRLEATESVYAEDRVKAGGKIKKGDLLEEKQTVYTARSVIVAAGGRAAPAHGTDGGGYPLLTGFGHPIIEPRPALCPLTTGTKPIRGLSGQRVRAGLTLYAPDGRLVHVARGEALFTESGVSGIAAMQLARFAQRGYVLKLDMREAIFGNESIVVGEVLDSRIGAGSHTVGGLLVGAATPELSAAIMRAAGLHDLERPARELDSRERRALCKAIEGFALPVIGTKGFDAAQVTAGGIDTHGFHPATMESRLVGGLYAAGEILDVDGDCGGYNLMLAAAMGLLAGRAVGSAAD